MPWTGPRTSSRQAADVAGGGVDPLPQRAAVQACGVDEDHALHGPTGEVHRPDMRLTQGAAGALRPPLPVDRPASAIATRTDPG